MLYGMKQETGGICFIDIPRFKIDIAMFIHNFRSVLPSRGDSTVRALGMLSTQWAPPQTPTGFSPHKKKKYVYWKILLDNHYDIYERRESYFVKNKERRANLWKFQWKF